MNEANGDPRYTMGRDREETDRLIQQSRLYDGLTRQLFNDAGIRSGMKVLDIGSGAGDVSLILAELVGPEGKVIGVDGNAEILETARARAKEAGFANVEFLAGDARMLELGGDFDALVGRLVLMYMADPAAALKQLIQRLRPEGIVAFEETDFTIYRSFSRPDTPLMNKLVEWLLAVFERSGAQWQWVPTCTVRLSKPVCPSPSCILRPRWAVRKRGQGIHTSPIPFEAFSRSWKSSVLRLPKRLTSIRWPSGFEKKSLPRNTRSSWRRTSPPGQRLRRQDLVLTILDPP